MCDNKKTIKMLFSSYGFDSPIMIEKFAQVIPRDKMLEDKTCLILPYAAHDAEKAFVVEKHDLVEFGFSESKIKMARCKTDITDTTPDYIYVPGGNTFKLMQSLNDMELVTDIIDCVKNKQTVYIGVSAGADIATKNIEYVQQLEDNNFIKEDFTALGLIRVALLCHFDCRSYIELKVCEQVSGKKVMTINNDQLLICENEKWRYVGEEK